MAKQDTKTRRNSRHDARDLDHTSELPDHEHWQRNEAPRRISFECKTPKQSEYLTAIESKRIIFGVGPAGVGKSIIPVSYAARELIAKRTQHIILTRPAVPADEDLGFIPGEVDEKMEPYITELRKVLTAWFGESTLEALIKRKVIEIAPLAYMRGRTFENSFIILDEAQNVKVGQMKMFLTRLGKNSTMVINGDITQIDIKEPSGLTDALHRFADLPDSQIVVFEESDSVRDPLIREILKRYRY